MPHRRPLLCALACVVLAGACAGPLPPPCDYPAGAGFAAPLDSLGLAEFLRLGDGDRARRRSLAQDWLRQARGPAGATQRLRALRNAAGLAPDQAATWLQLAELQRLLGDQLGAHAALDAGSAAVSAAAPEQRARLRLRLALARAWLHRDRGEWSWALAWADSAAAISPAERETRLLQGLLLGQRGELRRAYLMSRDLERKDPHLSDWAWIRGAAALGQGNPADAFHWLSAIPPDKLRRADYWNDLALACELLGNWAEARFFYQKAAGALPLRDASCIEQLSLPASGAPDAAALPVWLVFDRLFVAGSPQAYAREAAARFERAQGEARAHWGDEAVAALSACLRKGFDAAAVRALRGRVYAQMPADGLAEGDLSRAREEFAARGEVDAATSYWLGRLRLRAERHREAALLLREAIAADSTLAAAWNALGYALVMSGDLEEARAALDRTLALDPFEADAWYNRGLMHFNAGRWQEAASDLGKAAQLAPENEDIAAVLRRALLLREQARRRDAVEPAPSADGGS